MAFFSGELTQYTVQLFSGSGGIGAAIVCDAGSSGAVYLRFIRTGSLPANSTNVIASGTRQFYLHFAYGELAHVVDVLRNEKPVRFAFRDDTMTGYLTTSPEPVGEGEGV
jgi:hypothetical protein